MANKILTPVTLWQDIDILCEDGYEIISETVSDGLTIRELYFYGKPGKDKMSIKLYGVYVFSEQQDCENVILVQDKVQHCINLPLMKKIAKDLDVSVFSVDVAGKREEVSLYTIYPEEISFANYEKAKENLMYMPDDSTQTCWFYWTLATLYAVDFLRDNFGIKNVGLFGVNEGADILWKTSALDGNIKANCFVNAAGWAVYKGKYKYSDDSEPDFNDQVYKWLSGFDSQTYSKFIKTPILMLSQTNNRDYDTDRAYDTLIRTENNENAFIYYIIGSDCYLDSTAEINIKHFFDRYLTNSKEYFPTIHPKTEVKIENEQLRIEVSFDDEMPVKEVRVFVSEGVLMPALRDWYRVTDFEETEGNKITCTYNPDARSKIAFVIADITYESGVRLSSAINPCIFDDTIVSNRLRKQIIYDGSLEGAKAFIPNVNENMLDCGLFMNEQEQIYIEKGPFGIKGITCRGGLKTFKLNDISDKPKNGSSLMFDVFCEEDAQLKIEFIENVFEENQESYVYEMPLSGGKIWQNVIIEPTKSSNANNIHLKSFEKVNLMIISCDKDYLLNNILWI